MYRRGNEVQSVSQGPWFTQWGPPSFPSLLGSEGWCWACGQWPQGWGMGGQRPGTGRLEGRVGEVGGGKLASERLRVANSRPRSTPAATDSSCLVALTLRVLLLGGFDCKVPETSSGHDLGNDLSKPWEQLAPSQGEGRGGPDPPSALAPNPSFSGGTGLWGLTC